MANCQKEDDTIDSQTVKDKPALNITITSWQHVQNKNKVLNNKVNNFKTGFASHRNESSADYAFSIDEEQVQIIENSHFTTYTFLAIKANPIPNILYNYTFKANNDGTYEQYLLKYHYTISDQGDVIYDTNIAEIEFINDDGLIFNRTSCVPEFVEVLSGIVCTSHTTCTGNLKHTSSTDPQCECENTPQSCYKAGTSVCNLEYSYVYQGCPGGTIDIPGDTSNPGTNTGGGAENPNPYNNYPNFNIIPVINVQQQIVTILEIPTLGPNAQLDLYYWIMYRNNTLAVAEVYAFLLENDFSNETKLASKITLNLLRTNNLTNFYSSEYESILFEALDCCGISVNGLWLKYQAYAINEMLIIMESEYEDGHVFSNWELTRIALRAQLEAVHYGLDGAGLAPGVGIVFDVANATIYTVEGDWGNATLSLGAAVPLVGQWVTTAKWTKKIVTLTNGSKVYLRVYKLASGAVKFSGHSQLRKVLGITDSGIHAHHIIPYGQASNELVQMAAKSNNVWHINDIYNGIPMPNNLHLTGHHLYTNRVIERMDDILENLNPNDYVGAYDALMDLCVEIKNLIRFYPNADAGVLATLF